MAVGEGKVRYTGQPVSRKGEGGIERGIPEQLTGGRVLAKKRVRVMRTMMNSGDTAYTGQMMEWEQETICSERGHKKAARKQFEKAPPDDKRYWREMRANGQARDSSTPRNTNTSCQDRLQEEEKRVGEREAASRRRTRCGKRRDGLVVQAVRGRYSKRGCRRSIDERERERVNYSLSRCTVTWADWERDLCVMECCYCKMGEARCRRWSRQPPPFMGGSSHSSSVLRESVNRR